MSTNVQRRALPWTCLVAIDTTAVFVPGSTWESAAGVVAARASGEMAARNGYLQAQPAVQLANDILNPDGTTGLGPLMNANGLGNPTGVTSLTTGNRRYIRTGWLVSLSQGSALATANATAIVDLLY